MLNIDDFDATVNGHPGSAASTDRENSTHKPNQGSGQPPKIGIAFSERAVEAAIACGYSPIPGRWKPGKFKDDAGKWQDRELSDAKRPLQKGWQEFCTRTMTVEEQQAARKGRQPHLPQIHLAMGFNNTIAIDVDTNDPFIQKIVTDVIGRSPVSRVGGKGYADFLVVEGDLPKSEKWYGRKDDGSQSDAPIIEIMAHGTNVRIPPSYHPTAPGFTYRWVSDEHKIYNTCVDELPVITAEKIARLKAKLIELGYLYVKPETQRKPRKTVKKETLTEQLHKRYQAIADQQLRARMDEVAAQQKPGRDTAMRTAVLILGKFVHHGYISEATLMAEVESAAKSNGFDKEPGGVEQAKKTAQWALDKSAKDELPELDDRPFTGTVNGFGGWSKAVEDEIDAATANHAEYARAYAEEKAKAGRPQAGAKGADTPPPPPGGDTPPIDPEFCLAFSEEGMALHFADKFKRRLRYVNQWGVWMEWNGTRWVRESTLLAYDLIRRECRIAAAIAAQSDETKAALKDLSKAKTRSAIEALSRSDRRLAAKTDQWDADDWLLNTPGGMIDLRTGKLIGHDPAQYCTKITDVTPAGDCPLWKGFLDKVTAGNKELQAYLQRMCGYFLTGSVKEHALFFIHGPGGNGKGVFLNTISAILAMYHIVSPAQTFAEQKNQRHETEIARLDGARLVISQETEQGQYWAESRIKSLTGGDRLAGRFMRGDFFEFDPKFKLCIVGNHRPQLRAVDAAIRRRFQLIPFDVEILEEEKDRDLPTKLKAEYGGILAWMVEGCIKWQAEGLNPPEAVLAATADYLDSEDAIGSWLEDMCITPKSYPGDEMRQDMHKVRFAANEETQLAALFKSWKDYADASHTAARNNKYLGEQLAQRGFKKGKDKRGAFLRGLRLKTFQELVADGVSTKEGAF